MNRVKRVERCPELLPVAGIFGPGVTPEIVRESGRDLPSWLAREAAAGPRLSAPSSPQAPTPPKPQPPRRVTPRATTLAERFRDECDRLRKPGVEEEHIVDAAAWKFVSAQRGGLTALFAEAKDLAEVAAALEVTPEVARVLGRVLVAQTVTFQVTARLRAALAEGVARRDLPLEVRAAIEVLRHAIQLGRQHGEELDVLRLVPAITQEVLARGPSGLDPAAYPFERTVPTNALQAVILDAIRPRSDPAGKLLEGSILYGFKLVTAQLAKPVDVTRAVAVELYAVQRAHQAARREDLFAAVGLQEPGRGDQIRGQAWLDGVGRVVADQVVGPVVKRAITDVTANMAPGALRTLLTSPPFADVVESVAYAINRT